MTPELERLLYDAYPEFFLQHSWPASETLMSWGCAHGDGWYSIVQSVASVVTAHASETGRIPEQAVQIKEKFGGIRVYVRYGSEFLYGAVWVAEEVSVWICEVTGKRGRLRIDRHGIYMTRCKELAPKDGIWFSRPKSRRRHKKYPFLKVPVAVPRGWRRLCDCTLRAIRDGEKHPPTITFVGVRDGELTFETDGLVAGSSAAGSIAFAKELARRTDRKTGALFVPAIPQSQR